MHIEREINDNSNNNCMYIYIYVYIHTYIHTYICYIGERGATSGAAAAASRCFGRRGERKGTIGSAHDEQQL